MGLGSIVHHITHVVSDVVHHITHAIGEIVHHIVDTVNSVLHHILSTLGHFVAHIVTIVEHHFRLIGATILIAISVSTILSELNLQLAPLQGFLESHPTLAKVFYYATKVRTFLSNIYSGTVGRLLQKINPFLSKVAVLIKTTLKPFHLITHYIKIGVNWIKQSVLGKIFAKLKPVADFLYNLRMIATIKEFVDKKKYLKAFWTFLKWTDEKTSKEIEEVVASIESDIDSIRQEIYGSLESLNDALKVTDAKASYLQKTFEKLYKAFHVKLFDDLANGVYEFRQRVLESAENYIWRAEGKLDNTIKKLSDPFYSFLSTLYSVDQLVKQENNLAQAFAYNPFQKGFTQFTAEVNLTVYIPEPLLKLVFGR